LSGYNELLKKYNMMKTKDFSFFIERFNSLEMNESERQWFLSEMEGNEQLRKEVDMRRQTDNILKKQAVISLRTKLSEIDKTRLERKNSRKIRTTAILRYAAVFAGAAVVTGLIIFSGQTITSEEIVNQFYTSYEAPSAQRSATSKTNPDYILGLKYYNEQDYRNAASQFAKVLESNPGDMQTHLLSGVSNMEERKYNEAKKSFTTVIADNNNLFIESARWYLALCYVKTEDKDKASHLLVSIKNEGGLYSKDAKKVLRKLK
jgi:tetratricopeptide (TPR) repeat protein